MSKISELYGATSLVSTGTGVTQTDSTTENFSDYFTEALEKAAAEETVSETAAAETAEDAATAESDSSLADALADAIQEAMVNSILTANSSDTTTSYASSGLGIESLLLATAASGEITQTQLAMFMLSMMMNMAGEGSDTSMLYNIMSALLSQMQSDTSSDSESTRTTQIVSGYDSNTGSSSKSAVEWTGDTKSAAIPGVSETGSAVVPVSAGKPTTPSIVNVEGERSPEALRAVIDQFDVVNSERYRPGRNNTTYCNIFVWDVTSALGCEIPHYVDSLTGEPRTYPDITGAYELDANGVYDWLLDHGQEYGWREVTAEEAQNSANEGYPVVAAMSKKSTNGVGHVQIVCPSEDGTYNSTLGPTVAQAGSTNTNYSYQIYRYTTADLKNVRYFVHD